MATNIRNSLSGLYLATFLCLLIAGEADSLPRDEPLETIRVSNEKVIALLGTNFPLTEEQESRVIGAIEEVTSFPSIVRSTLGEHWDSLSGKEQTEFEKIFTRLLCLSSTRKLGQYRAERFHYLDQEVEDDSALVRTLAFFKDKTIRLDYVMRRINGDWKIINYFLNDVDRVGNYRKQFNRLLKRGSFAELLSRLEKKLAEYEERRAP